MERGLYAITTRQIQLSGALNVRDLGGYKTIDGKQTKWHKLIRAGQLSQLTDNDQKMIKDYGITCIIDLRSEAEIESEPDIVPFGIDYVKLPLFNNDETESTDTVQKLNKFYSDSAKSGYLRMLYVYRRLIVNRQPRNAYRKFFQALSKNGEEKTILFHCSAGKDRTGMCSALFLGLLGVSGSQIKSDYLLTNQLCIPRVKHRIEVAKRAHMNQNFIKSVVSLSTVSGDYYDQAMSIVDFEFGGIIPYLVDFVGLSEDVIQRLKDIYLK